MSELFAPKSWVLPLAIIDKSGCFFSDGSNMQKSRRQCLMFESEDFRPLSLFDQTENPRTDCTTDWWEIFLFLHQIETQTVCQTDNPFARQTDMPYLFSRTDRQKGSVWSGLTIDHTDCTDIFPWLGALPFDRRRKICIQPGGTLLGSMVRT